MIPKGVAVLALCVLAACAAPPPDAAPPPESPAAPSPESPSPDPPAEPSPSPTPREEPRAQPRYATFPVPPGTRPHDVAPAPDGRVWYTGQRIGTLGVLDPATGETHAIALGSGSAPHGVIVGPDGAPWITDGGLDAIVRVDSDSLDATRFPLPGPGSSNLNTAAFDGDGVHWFTGQAGIYGRVDPETGAVDVFDAPRGRGPYGIATTPDGTVWFSSLAGSYIARIEADGSLEVVDVPTPGGGARRVWSDSGGLLWVTEWYSGHLARYDPGNGRWDEWLLPGDNPQPYAVYVDDEDVVWVTDFGANALVAFEPDTETFRAYPLPSPDAQVRQLLGRPGEVWGAGSRTDEIVVLYTSARSPAALLDTR